MSHLNELLSHAASGALSATDIFLAIALAYGGGLLASLTPCVYPMIPITVSVVGGGANVGQRPSWKKLVARSSAYIGGMTVTYSFLGVAAGLTGRVFGSFTNTSGWYVGLGVILTLAALIMLDIIPFDPQTWIEGVKRRFSKGGYKAPVHNEIGIAGAFMLGASSGLVAAPCTTPVLTSILAFIAKTQSIGLGLILMASFSLGLGTLLMVVATFAGALQVMPRSGMWMKTIKLISGLILLGFAEYLFFQAGQLGGSL